MSKQHRTTAAVASSRSSRRLKRSAWMLSAAVAAIALYSPAHAQLAPNALPTGGTVVAGSATIATPAPSAMTVDQSSNRAVINWNNFDIGSGASVVFNQPSNTSVTVNRVVSGAAPSEIAGAMSANGIVAVLNPNGVLFSGSANVDVGGLIASTGDIDQTAFMTGGGTLDISGANGGEIVIRAGADITITNAGLGAFVAPTVRNNGIITATGGRVQLGAGTAFTLDLAGDGLLAIGLGADSPLIENFGDISGRRIEVTARQAAAVVDQTIRTGVLPVGSVRVDGTAIVLDAAGEDFAVSSDITGTGNVTVNANRIYGAADINVDGNLTLNVNSQGAVADTTAGSANWINDALGVIGSQVDATTINLGAGLYRSGTVINNSNVTIDGQGAARIGWTNGIENAVDIWGDNVTVKNLEIFGPADSAYTSFGWGSTNSRGIFVHNGADNASVLNNDIHDIRTGIIVDGRNLNAMVTGNRVENTKSGISVQYTDGSNINLLGNTEGAIGNEWGINVHLNGILQGDGTTINPSTSMVGGVPVGLLGTASLTEQARLLALSNANAGLSVQNIAYSAANRTRAYVKVGGATNTQGSQLSALGTIQAGVDAVVTGGTVHVGAGTFTGNVNISKSNLTLLSIDGRDATTIEGVSGVGAAGAVVISGANDVTIGGAGHGFAIVGIDNGNAAIENAAVYLQGNHSGVTISGNRITAAGDHGLVSEFGVTAAGLTIDGNIFDGKTYVGSAPSSAPFSQQFTVPNVSRQLVVLGGGNGGGNTSDVTFTNNSVIGDSGLNTAVTIDAQGATITGNSFATTTGGFGSVLRARGTNTLIADNVLDGANVGAGANLLYVRNSVFGTGQASFADLLGDNTLIGTGAWSNLSATGFHTFSHSIQTAINEAAAGAVVTVRPGDYSEGVTGVDYFGGAGGQRFGLYVYKNDITLRGVDAAGHAITDAADVAAFVTSKYEAGFGAQHFVSGSGVTIEGLGFKPVATGTNKTLEVIGDGFTLRDSVVDNRGNPTAANFYISDFEQPGKPAVESFTLEGNLFYGGTTTSAMVVIASGVGRNTDISNRLFTANRIIGSSLAGQRGFQIQGRIPTTAWQQLTAGAVTVTNNYFDNVDVPVRTVGELTQALAFDDLFRNNGNVFADGAVLAYAGSTLDARATLTAAGDADFRITSKISDSVSRAVAGDTVRMLDGTYDLGTAQLVIDRAISLVGQSQAGVIIDGRAVSANGLGTLSVIADNVSLSNFTLYGSELAGGNYGIKVQPNPAGHVNTPGGDDQRLNNFAISDVTVRGSRRAELDLNGVAGATISNFTADGRRVADGTGTEGAGIQITDSAGVTLTGVHTLKNNWGGVALYQSNKASGYDGQTTNITIDASLNQFDEANGLFSQLESTTQGFGTLNLAGFDYAVRNTGHRPDGSGFTFFRTGLADATAFALALGAPSTSSIEGYAGDHFSNVFTVVDGLTIGSATRDVRAGGTVNVAAGTFNEAVSITRSMTLAGAGIDATSITGGIAVTSGFTGLTLRDFAVSGSASGTSVINNSGVLTNLTVDGVRIDGGSVANRHGFIGGQIGGDIAITDSEFLNIRGWAAFDTRSGASGNDGAQITSGLFANNRIDNTIGHIAFRQQIGSATLPYVTFSGNTLTNTGNATNSFGAIFKAFNADTVDFTGNTVSGVGTSGFNPAGEAAYGAVLMTRGTATLNVTGNSFTNNNQVLAIEPGRGLATVTNVANNSFTNNAYSIYLPTNLAGAGTINFGAGNDFVAGANTVQHIVWRSASALDLSNVAFNGVLASDMNLAGRFALADLISDGIDRSGAGLATLVGGALYVTNGSGTDSAFRALALAAAGDTINLSSGTHLLSNTLFVTKDGVSVLGQGSGLTTIDASGHNNYGIRVHGDDVTLGGFALLGSSAAVGNANYGVKVESGGDLNARNTGFTIRDVAISGTRKTGLDLNAVVDALIDGVSVTGATNGNGIAITDSAEVTVQGTTTSGNAWGGLALYQSNNLAGGGSNQQLTGVTIAASNAFGEANGLYFQDSSATLDAGPLAIAGYDYAVRNFAHRADGNQFVFFQKDLAAATGWALGLGTPSSSSIEGYAGDRYSNVFTVVDGLGIAAAARDVRANGTINVGAGTYASGSTITANGVTLNGAAGARIDATHNGDNGITINADGVTVQGFEIFGAADQPFNLYGWGSAITRGVVVLNGADNATVTGNNIHDVRNGVLIDGRNTGAAITGNTIDNTKSAISVQYTDGSNIDLSANAEGANGNEWGIIAHLNGIWNGTTITPSGGALGAATPLSEQQRLLALSAANNGMAVYNQAWSALNRTRAYVTTAGTGGAQGSQLTPTSLQGGLDAVVTGGTVHIAAGAYAEDVVLNALRVLDMGAISVNSLTLGAGAAGTAIGTSITATGAIDLASGVLLSADTSLTGGAITLGAITSPHALTLSGDTLAIGQAALASLTATGANITTAGATTSGAQSYTGATTLNGAYSSGGAFTVAGATTLGGTTTVVTNGANASFGTVAGGHALAINAGNGSIALGALNGLSSLSATGAAIATAGASTSGNQQYVGATSLSGTYATAGGAFAVEGPATLAGGTTVETQGGDAAFGALSGAQALAVDAGMGNVSLGAIDGLASLSATGAAITTLGASTTGAQSYTGATTLNGAYAAGGGFTVAGATTLGGATTVATSGADASFGTVAGDRALSIDAGAGNVSFGAVNGLASLTATGAEIVTAGASTTGTQRYTGATTLTGSYTAGGTFAVDGATVLAAATTVATNGGDARFGTLSGANSFAVNAGAGDVTLGAVSGLASLTATGGTIATVGASTTGAQSYTGATSLNGTYAAGGGFTVAGATTLGGATSVATGGSNASLGAVGGTGSLNVEAGAGNIALGAVSGLATLTATGSTIVTAGAATTGAQSYTGATTLDGAYATNGGGFTVTGATTLGGATTVTSGNGAILLGAVNGAIAGGQALTLDAGTGTATLGAFGAQNRLGAVSVTAGQPVLGGAGYAANSLNFSGGVGATVRLTQATTTFNTSLPGGAGGAITIVPQLIGTVNGQQNLVFVAGNGLTLNSGDVTIGNVGSDALRLGTMTVTANDFSAQTVKLAGKFTSLLSGSQVFSANTLDTLGDVVAQVAGVESGPIRAGGSVAIDAGGSGTGSIIAGGPVALGYTSDVTRSITSTGPVSVSTTGSIGGAINSGGSVNLATTAGAISGTVAATGPVTAQTTTGAITAAINSSNAVTLGSTTGTIAGTVQAAGPVAATTTGGAISGTITSSGTVTLGTTSGTIGGTVNAAGPVSATATTGNIAAAIQSNAGVTVGSTSGAVGGSIQAGGAVNVNAGGSVTAAVTTSGSASLASTSGGVSSTVAAGGPVTVAAPGPVTSAITSGSTVAVTSNTPVAVQVNGGTVTVNAPGGTVTGVFSDIVTDSKGTFVVNDEPVIGSGMTDARQIIIDSFLAPAGGTAAADGTIQLPVGLALGLIAPAGDGKGGQRPPVAVNSVERLGELLRLGYTAIIIQIDDTNLDLEEELDGAAQ